MTRRSPPPLMVLPIDSASVVLRARRHARDVAEALGLGAHRQARVATAVSELVRNAWEHAREGRVRFELDGDPAARLVVHVDDAGDGIARLHERLARGTGELPGATQGLEVARRLADRFDVATGPGGTRATVTFDVADPDDGVAPAALASVRALELPRGRRATDGPTRAGRRAPSPLPSPDDAAEELRGLQEHVALLTGSLVEAQSAVRVRDEMLAIVTHDLRGPLGAIVSNAELLEYVEAVDPKTAAAIAEVGAAVLRSARQMDKLIADLLDLAALREGRLTVDLAPHDAFDLVEACAREHAPVVGRAGLTLVHGGARGPTLVCDRDRVLQLLSNLVGNAIKFSEPGGRIALDVQRVDETVRFSVLDTGRGMTPVELERMFDRLWQRDGGDRRGIGLGLSIVRALVDAHGGTVDVESEPGTGTCVRVALPLAGPARPAQET